MATITSAGSGNWTTGATWVGGVKPANGDAVVIANSHVIVYDEDMSGWANGIAGMTLGAGAILQASTSTGNYYLKMAGNIAATGVGAELRAGTAETAYPSDCTFKILMNGNYQIQGNVSNYLTCKFYCYEPVVRFIKLISATPKAITGISKANPCVVTCPGHGLSAGNTIWLVNVGGMTELDGMRCVCSSVINADSFYIRWTWQVIGIDSTNFTTYTSGGYVCPDIGEAVGQTKLEVDTDVTAEPEWTRSGAKIRVVNLNYRYSAEDCNVSSVTSSAINISSGLTAAKYSGSLVVLTSRNVQLLSTSTNITSGLIYRGTGHVLGCCFLPGATGTNLCTAAYNVTIPKSGVSTQGTGAYTFNAVYTGSVSGVIASYYAFTGCSNVTVETDGILAGVYYGWHAGSHWGRFLGTAYGVQQICTGSNNGAFYFNGTAIGCNGIACSSLQGSYVTGVAKYCSFVMTLCPGGIISNFKAYGVASIYSQAADCYAENVEQNGGNYFINTGKATLTNCVCKGVYADIYAARVKAYNCSFNGVTYEFNWLMYLGTNDLSESYDHDQVAGAFRSWTRGGITSSNTSEKPTGRTRSYQSVCESATYPCWHQREILVEAGRQVRIRIWGKADAGVTYKAQLVLPTDDPLVTGSGTGEWEQTMTADGSWYEYKTAWTNTATYPVTIYLRFLATAASGNAYCDFQWAFDRSPSRR